MFKMQNLALILFLPQASHAGFKFLEGLPNDPRINIQQAIEEKCDVNSKDVIQMLHRETDCLSDDRWCDNNGVDVFKVISKNAKDAGITIVVSYKEENVPFTIDHVFSNDVLLCR